MNVVLVFQFLLGILIGIILIKNGRTKTVKFILKQSVFIVIVYITFHVFVRSNYYKHININVKNNNREYDEKYKELEDITKDYYDELERNNYTLKLYDDENDDEQDQEATNNLYDIKEEIENNYKIQQKDNEIKEKRISELSQEIKELQKEIKQKEECRKEDEKIEKIITIFCESRNAILACISGLFGTYLSEEIRDRLKKKKD